MKILSLPVFSIEFQYFCFQSKKKWCADVLSNNCRRICQNSYNTKDTTFYNIFFADYSQLSLFFGGLDVSKNIFKTFNEVCMSVHFCCLFFSFPKGLGLKTKSSLVRNIQYEPFNLEAKLLECCCIVYSVLMYRDDIKL